MFRFFYSYIMKFPLQPPDNPFNIFPRISPQNISWFQNHLIKIITLYRIDTYRRANLHVITKISIIQFLSYYELYSIGILLLIMKYELIFLNMLFYFKCSPWVYDEFIKKVNKLDFMSTCSIADDRLDSDFSPLSTITSLMERSSFCRNFV